MCISIILIEIDVSMCRCMYLSIYELVLSLVYGRFGASLQKRLQKCEIFCLWLARTKACMQATCIGIKAIVRILRFVLE